MSHEQTLFWFCFTRYKKVNSLIELYTYCKTINWTHNVVVIISGCLPSSPFLASAFFPLRFYGHFICFVCISRFGKFMYSGFSVCISAFQAHCLALIFLVVIYKTPAEHLLGFPHFRQLLGFLWLQRQKSTSNWLNSKWRPLTPLMPVPCSRTDTFSPVRVSFYNVLLVGLSPHWLRKQLGESVRNTSGWPVRHRAYMDSMILPNGKLGDSQLCERTLS